MTTTAVRQDDLKVLGRLLRERLHSDAVLTVPFGVQCALKDGELLILVQHEPPLLSNPSSLFSTLQQAIYAWQPINPKVGQETVSAWERAQQVRIYLRVSGQKQPYATHDFTMTTRVFSSGNASELASVLALPPEGNRQRPWEYPPREATQPESEPSWHLNAYLDDDEPSEDTETTSDWEGEPSRSAKVESKSKSRQPKRDRSRSRGIPPLLTLPLLAVGATVAGMLSFVGVYFLTRPCVIDACPQLQTSAQLSRESIQTLQRAKSVQELTAAQQQLATATQQLQNIPPWSRHYASAQNLLQAYTVQSQRLDRVLDGFNKAAQAAEKSQNSPHTVEEWREIYTLWSDAIAKLRQVPNNSPMYRIAQQRLQDYQLNLAIINQRIKTEQQSEQRLKEAKNAAQVAQGRQANARSLENWQQVFASWQAAVNTLIPVPPTTMGFKEAQDLLAKYRPQLATARDRLTREQLSANYYNQANSLAVLAKRLEQQGQWSQAVATWRQASTYVQQVPNGTFYYAQSQPLIDNYANALKQAENNLKLSLVLQKARLDLNRVCSGVPRICDYTVANNGIKVYLTPAYYNSLQRTQNTAELSGDYNALTGLQDHLKTLQVALEAVSQNANLPIALYNYDRSLTWTYAPKQ